MNSHGAHRFLSFHTIKAATAPPLRIAGMRYVYSIMQTNYQDYQYKSRSRPPSLPRPENDIENIVYRHSDTNHAKNGFRDRHATTGSCYAATLDPHEKPPCADADAAGDDPIFDRNLYSPYFHNRSISRPQIFIIIFWRPLKISSFLPIEQIRPFIYQTRR